MHPGELHLLTVAADSAQSDDSPLADLSLGELRALGVADQLAGAVQKARTASELELLELPEPALCRLRFRLLQKGLREPLDRRAESIGHLEQYLRGEITDLLLNLDATQRPIVHLPVPGPIIVRGVAGSGKTAVALHRVHTLLAHGSRLEPPRVLYLTFNRALADAAVELLQALGVRPGVVESRNIHAWCKQFLGAAAPRHLLKNDERLGLIQSARAQVQKSSRSSALWTYPDSFWEDEIHRIKGRVVTGAGDYLAMARHGAGRALDTRLRELVWAVFEAYRGLSAARGLADWDDMLRLAHEKLTEPGARIPAYDHVFVDEGQDFSVIGLRIASLLSGAHANLMVTYDPAQSIYEKGFRWRACGIAAHGSRSFALLTNHRNSAEILDFARPLLTAIRNDPTETDGGGQEDLIDPQASARSGEAPRTVKTPPRQEAEHLARLIAEDIQQRHVPPGNIAVLCLKSYKRDRVLQALSALGIVCRLLDRNTALRLTEPSVKVMTMHSAKGLEFPVVYLLASARDVAPPASLTAASDRAASIANHRKVLYMAMTRALSRLTLVHDAAEGSPMDALLCPGRQGA